MKKIINYALIAVLLIAEIFILTGCDNKKDTNIIDEPVEINSDLPTTTSTMTDKDYYEKAVEFVKNEIIKTEDHINTKEGYHKFAIYEGFGVAEENGTTYAYMHIGDLSYYIENGKVEQGSGSSMAYKVKFVNGEPVSYENPTDGAGQEADYKRLFPKDVFNKIYGYNFDFTKLDDLANEYYK